MCIICTNEYKEYEEITCSNCMNLKIIPRISSLKRLYISNCINLVKIKELPLLEELSTSKCINLIEIPMLPSLNFLSCDGCTSLVKIAVLPLLKKLYCFGCVSLRKIPMFPVLQELNCIGCVALLEIPIIPSLETLWCLGCTGLHKTHPLQQDYTKKIVRENFHRDWNNDMRNNNWPNNGRNNNNNNNNNNNWPRNNNNNDNSNKHWTKVLSDKCTTNDCKMAHQINNLQTSVDNLKNALVEIVDKKRPEPTCDEHKLLRNSSVDYSDSFGLFYSDCRDILLENGHPETSKKFLEVQRLYPALVEKYKQKIDKTMNELLQDFVDDFFEEENTSHVISVSQILDRMTDFSPTRLRSKFVKYIQRNNNKI